MTRDPRPSALPCKVCGAGSPFHFHLPNRHGLPERLDFHLCPDCGLVFLGTAISQEQLTDIYDTGTSEKHYQAIDPTLTVKMDRALQDITLLLEHAGASPSILDMGCGYGHLIRKLEEMDRGIRGVGLELPGYRAEACRRQGMTVHTCSLAQIPETFDGIVMLDVAEHVMEPNRIFAESHDRLAPGGFLYIHTPRRCFWDSLFLRLVKLPWLRRVARSWLATRVSILHLHLWTDRALDMSLKKAGFEKIRILRELELSWPLELYVDAYLGRKMKLPAFMRRMLLVVLDWLFLRLRTLRNKAICTAS